MCCTCQSNEMREQMQSKHQVRLLLRPPAQQAAIDSLAQFDMLFSSKPYRIESQLSHWQDVELLVPRNSYTNNNKRTRFADIVHDNDDHASADIMLARRMWRVEKGQFCNLIDQAANWRLCLSIQGERLQHCIEPIKQRVNHVPGVSLAKVLSSYRLTARMKLLLAYIIAYSVWQYYDSDWMKTRWTSESIQFMKECHGSGDQGKLFTWKPYLSIDFNDKDPQCYEYNRLPEMIHDYPRVRALGIMLVEIGIGFPINKDAKKAQHPSVQSNSELLTAFSYAEDENRWRDFDYPDYMSAVRQCLKPDSFDQVLCPEGSSSREWKQAIEQRRSILYDKVVFPLEDLLQGTKWMEDYTKVAPLSTPLKVTTIQESTLESKDPERRKMASPRAKRSKSERDASRWLSRLRGLNRELAQVAPALGLDDVSRRVRIAILDTGYDDDTPFFFSPSVQERLKGWKDLVDGSANPQDSHGHGTHLVSLVLKCAPEADIYVARIAAGPDEILKSSNNIAKVRISAKRKYYILFC